MFYVRQKKVKRSKNVTLKSQINKLNRLLCEF